MGQERHGRDGAALRVGISGSYGGMNLGDEAILAAMLNQLRQVPGLEVVVFSEDPADTCRRHGVAEAIAIRDLGREEARSEVDKLDLLVLGGGGILFDGKAESFLREVQIAHDVGVPVMIYAIGAGPLETPSARNLVRACLDRAAAVTVRDRAAKLLLEDLGISQPVEVTADPALLLEPEPLPAEFPYRESLDRQRRLVGLSVREPGPAAPQIEVQHYHALLSNAADFMVDRLDADVVFVPMERNRRDLQHSHAVISQMHWPERATVIKGDYTSGQILALMSRFSFALGMRLHFLLFAALARVPFVALPYASKVEGFLAELGLEMPPLAGVSAGRLIAHIDRSWDLRDRLTAQVAARVPKLQERARGTHRRLLELLATRKASSAAGLGVESWSGQHPG